LAYPATRGRGLAKGPYPNPQGGHGERGPLHCTRARGVGDHQLRALAAGSEGTDPAVHHDGREAQQAVRLARDRADGLRRVGARSRLVLDRQPPDRSGARRGHQPRLAADGPRLDVPALRPAGRGRRMLRSDGSLRREGEGLRPDVRPLTTRQTICPTGFRRWRF
jgi:hypothetical protein